jgi:hypothetical protein
VTDPSLHLHFDRTQIPVLRADQRLLIVALFSRQHAMSGVPSEAAIMSLWFCIGAADTGPARAQQHSLHPQDQCDSICCERLHVQTLRFRGIRGDAGQHISSKGRIDLGGRRQGSSVQPSRQHLHKSAHDYG